MFSLVSTVAHAVDTATKISLDDRAHFTMELESNKLVFRNAPVEKHMNADSFLGLVCGDTNNDNTVDVSRVAVCVGGKNNGVVVDLTGLPDGIYTIGSMAISGDASVKLDKLTTTVFENPNVKIATVNF